MNLGPIAGELLVSVNNGDLGAVRQGQAARGEPLLIEGTTKIYVGVDDPQVRAVELFDGLRIIYVRSELATETLKLEQLVAMATSVNDFWSDHDQTTVTIQVPDQPILSTATSGIR